VVVRVAIPLHLPSQGVIIMTTTAHRGQIKRRRTPEEERERRQKAERLTAAGYEPAYGPGTCCLCSKRIHRGQWIRQMPTSWNPDSKRRHAHYRCVDQLKAQIRAKLRP
jgi:hypothetical protein